MNTPPVDTSREAIEAAFSDVLAGKGFSILKLSSIVHALRTALDAAEGRPIPTAGFDEHDSKIIADLEVLGADRDSGFWPPMIALGVRRILIRTIAQRDAEKARADRLEKAMRELVSGSRLLSDFAKTLPLAFTTAYENAKRELATKDSPT